MSSYAKKEFQLQIAAATCCVLGWEDASNNAHRTILRMLLQGFPSKQASVLCEPSLARTTKRPPDVVLVDVIAGVHVIEVEGHDLQQIESLEPGGQIKFRYEKGSRTRNPIGQVRNAMFDIKNATEQAFVGDLTLPFEYWVAFHGFAATTGKHAGVTMPIARMNSYLPTTCLA